MNKGLIDIGEETAFTTEFKQREPDDRCFRCLLRGHRQMECTNELTCSRCAGVGRKEENARQSRRLMWREPTYDQRELRKTQRDGMKLKILAANVMKARPVQYTLVL